MQTNLHRVSEFAVTAKQKADDGSVKHEARAAIKRLREVESDTESDVEEVATGTNISASGVECGNRADRASGHWHDSSKTEKEEDDSTVFLSFDWKNEDPYEKAVDRYSFSFVFLAYYIHGNGCHKLSSCQFWFFCCMVLW